MANPTTNFGWVMPTSSSLVTNLPADFNTFGQAVDTSMSELLGGTTGQVLSKTSNTNMDFTWVTPTDQTPLTTKGDLFTFTTVDARLAVGNNGETLVADSSASTGLRYQQTQTRNAFYNSAFDVWQRGTSIALTTTSYTADRWFGYGSVAGRTVSRQTGDTGFNYCARVQRDSGNTNTSAIYFAQPFEIIDATKFAGKTVTWSFYARAGANYSAASSGLGVTMLTGTGSTDSNAIVSGYTGQSALINTSITLTTSWQRFSVTASIGSTITQFTPYFTHTPVGTAGAADYFEVTGVQLETGSVATSFVRQSGSIQGELAACQRYYVRVGGSDVYERLSTSGSAQSATSITALLTVPVTMRVAPTAVEYSTLTSWDGANLAAVTNVAISQKGKNTTELTVTVGGGGLTTYRPYYVIANGSTNGYLALSSEL
jgi:hypothetical protein